jgi:hypothetical protein
VSALDELRENFRAAAQRDIAARKRKRRRRRATGALVAVLVGGSAAAGAADLISVGKPAKTPIAQGHRYRPATTDKTIVLTAAGGQGQLPVGLTVFSARNGDKCVRVGRMRGYALGTVSAGQWHPYPADAPAACGDVQHGVTDMVALGDFYAVFGITPSDARAVASGKITKPPGPQRAFLFIYRGKTPRVPPIRFLRNPH